MDRGDERLSIAAAALADRRPALASSFRFHRPRGPVCGRGHCFSCELTTADGRRVLACLEPAAGRRRRRLHPLRPLGRIAERWPPWFYERRFLRTPVLRQASLDVLRRVSAAGRLGSAGGAAAPRAFERVEADTVVVGRGGVEGALVLDAHAGDVALGLYGDRVLGALHRGRLAEIHFERLVLATGSYERLPPIPGNDLPGVLGDAAFARYARVLPRGSRVAVWGEPERRARAEELAEREELEIVWSDEAAPRRIAGRGRVQSLDAGERVRCDVFVAAVRQPALELALQAGARVRLTGGELPVLVLEHAPAWLELRGSAGARSSGVPDVRPDDAAFACLCEDVRVGDVRAAVADGFGHPELVKRRTGAMTGPCQGKLCSSAVLAVLRESGVDATPTTARPLARAVTLGELAADA